MFQSGLLHDSLCLGTCRYEFRMNIGHIPNVTITMCVSAVATVSHKPSIIWRLERF
jgi:hypothetical protein